MCLIVKKLNFPEYTGYKVLAKKENKYYSIFTGQEFSVGKVLPPPEVAEPITSNWSSSLTTRPLKKAVFYNPDFVGSTSVFCNYSSAYDFYYRVMVCPENTSFDLVLVEITIAKIKSLAYFSDAYTVTGGIVTNITEEFDSTKFKNLNTRVTPDKIFELKSNEIFVFGSNYSGYHGAGAALQACNKFGAEWSKGIGLYGQSYALPTKDQRIKTLPLMTISQHVREFIEHASENPELNYLVTEIGCGLAGYRPIEIAPIFKGALYSRNIYLPKRFLQILNPA